MNLDFKFIKFPAPYPSELTFIKFPMKSRIDALNLGQFHFNKLHNPILQLKVQTLSVRLTSNSTSHGQEAIGSTSEYSRTLNLRTWKEANKLFNLIKFPMTPRHTINQLIQSKIKCLIALQISIGTLKSSYSIIQEVDGLYHKDLTLKKLNLSWIHSLWPIKTIFMDYTKMTNTLCFPPTTPLTPTWYLLPISMLARKSTQSQPNSPQTAK